MIRRLSVLALLGCAACSLLVSLDDLGGAPTTDGGADVLVGGDASDASVIHEGGPGCDAMSPTPTFCEDFDEPDAKQPTDIGIPNATGSGVIAIDGVDFFSAPRSFFGTVPLSASGNNLANIELNVTKSTPSAVEIAFEIELDSASTTASCCSVYQSSGTNVTFVVSPTGVWLQEGAFSGAPMYVDHAPHTVDWSAGWLKLDLKLVQSPPSETIMINGAEVETQALDSRFTWGGAMDFVLGLTYVPANSSAISMRIDNLAVWVTP
ncbi:MAG TPA: hypothetical protein VH054_19765 [Polyangiaceae bacterium]|jgi:hypothetical protein|nr:hypothetical protein [Polyangiaceae bacterium]